VENLLLVKSLAKVAQRVEERAAKGRMQVVFPGDPAFPTNLVGVPGAPPLLFFRGTVQQGRRRVAMVGSRNPEGGFLSIAQRLAKAVASAGVGVVSGAADGVDDACHKGCLEAGQETWAFLGSALDELDPAQAKLAPLILDAGGSLYSELPPGVRASTVTFPRRNRLISGASDAVLVLRAKKKSGALHTVKAAHAQGRPVLALPGDLWNPAAVGCNELIANGEARICLGPEDVWAALGTSPGMVALPSDSGSGILDASASLSKEAKSAYAALSKTPTSFDEVRSATELSSAALTSALCELELNGLAVQHPGKRYERI
jgi:DNA processing protein